MPKEFVAVIGLGYVGLPLAVAMAGHYRVVGFDIDPERIRKLRQGYDHTREVSSGELKSVEVEFTDSSADMAACDVYIVTVPTPVDRYKRPHLGPLEDASELVGRQLSPGNVVVYESTVFPGATEEVCAPILERASGLKLLSGNVGQNDPEAASGFFLAYSPERINPGDAGHRLRTIKKVTSGSTPEIADAVDKLYARVIEAGTYKAQSIRVAEAAKVIENTQRDVNIALVNELALLFSRLDIDTEAVLEAAGTKWNFLPFRPGLVGGHCIGVDPYYLTHKAQEIGHHPEMILAGRRINDQMGLFVASEVIKLMTRKRIPVVDARVLVLGLTFKENCPDLRNTRVIDIIREFASYHARVDVHDPWADRSDAQNEYGIDLLQNPPEAAYDAIIVAVPHRQFQQMSAEAFHAFGRDPHVLYDLKWLLSPNDVDGRL